MTKYLLEQGWPDNIAALYSTAVDLMSYRKLQAMILNPKPIVVLIEVGNAQKAVHVVLKHGSSSIYDIIVDNKIHGEARRRGDKSWDIITDKKSPVQQEHYNSLSTALDRATTPNS